MTRLLLMFQHTNIIAYFLSSTNIPQPPCQEIFVLGIHAFMLSRGALVRNLVGGRCVGEPCGSGANPL